MVEKQNPRNEDILFPKVKCECCNSSFSYEEIIFIDGEHLCKECFTMLEASRDTH